jgi:hypothetical protein
MKLVYLLVVFNLLLCADIYVNETGGSDDNSCLDVSVPCSSFDSAWYKRSYVFFCKLSIFFEVGQKTLSIFPQAISHNILVIIQLVVPIILKEH